MTNGKQKCDTKTIITAVVADNGKETTSLSLSSSPSKQQQEEKKKKEREALEEFMIKVREENRSEIEQRKLETKKEIIQKANKEGKIHIEFPTNSLLIESNKEQFRRHLRRNSNNLELRKQSMGVCQRFCFSIMSERFAIRINKPSIEDLVVNGVSFDEIKRIYANSYNSWKKLMYRGLLKKHITQDKWLSVDDIVSLNVGRSRLYNALGFRLEDFILCLIGPNVDSIEYAPKIGIDAIYLLNIGFGRDEMMDVVQWTLSSMMEFLGFGVVQFKKLHLENRDYRRLAKGNRSTGFDQVEKCFGIVFRHKNSNNKH